MRRIIRADAICLRVQDYSESSKIVTLLTREHGKVNCIAKGARRVRSKYGAALDLLAVARVIYYWRETHTLYTLSDAELIRSHSGLASPTARFLAAEQMAEFALRTLQPNDPGPQLYDLLSVYLDVCETAQGAYPSLVCSFLLKAASFLGFRPELRRCLICRRTPEPTVAVFFEPLKGGVVCARCAGENPAGTRLAPAELGMLAQLLYLPAEEIVGRAAPAVPTEMVLDFLAHHFDPLILNSFRRPLGDRQPAGRTPGNMPQGV